MKSVLYGGPRGISRPCGMRQVTLSGTRTPNAGLRYRKAPHILERDVFDYFSRRPECTARQSGNLIHSESGREII